MILYTLKCAAGHKFEAWFRDSATYEAQAGQGAIACPHCGDAGVSKAIMAPRLNTGALVPADGQPSVQRTVEFLTAFKKSVEENADYVGDRFAEEARDIHYGETERRNIYGEASLAEARDLAEEGIAVMPLPFHAKTDA